METLAEMMQDDGLAEFQHLIAYEFHELLSDSGERIYSDLNSADWWLRSEHLLRSRVSNDSFLLPIILYLDGTQLDVTGKTNAKPVCISLGNFGGKLRVWFIYLILSLFNAESRFL